MSVLFEDIEFDSTYSMTGSSAHCIAKWSTVVPSNRLEGIAEGNRLCGPSLLAAPDCSLRAFDIAAVSPPRNASKTLNSFTDCSMEDPAGEKGEGCISAGEADTTFS